MKINEYKNSGVNNLLLPVLFAGQFLAMAIESILKITGFYFLIFLISCIYGGKEILINKNLQAVNSVDIFWAGYFMIFLVSAGLVGNATFSDFLILFTTQAIIPFFLGRALQANCNIKKINFHLNLIFAFYFFILMYIYIQDPSAFNSDRFYPFLDRSVTDGGGDPTQLFLGYGLAAVLFSNYIIVRSKSEYAGKQHISKYFIICTCIILLVLFGSRSAIIAVLAVVIGNDFGDKLKLKKFFYIIFGAFAIVGVGINFVPEERVNFLSELWLIFDIGFDGLVCLSAEDGSILYRLSGIFQSLDLFVSNPIFGVGVGNYGWFHCGARGDFIYPHNIITQILAELGLVGILIFFSCIYKTYKINHKFLNSDKSDELVDAKKLFFNFWIFCLIAAVFSGNSYDDPLLYLLTGLVSKKTSLKRY